MPSVNNFPNLTQSQINALSGSVRPGATVFNTTTNTLNATYDNGNSWKIFPGDNYAISAIEGGPSTTSPYYNNSQFLNVTVSNSWQIGSGLFHIKRIEAFANFTISNAGTGYTINNIVAIPQGAIQDSLKCTIRVDTIGVGGAIATFTVLNGGQYDGFIYTTVPYALQTVTGTGSGAQFLQNGTTVVQEYKNISDFSGSRLIAGATGTYQIDFYTNVRCLTNVNRYHGFGLALNLVGNPNPPLDSNYYDILSGVFTGNEYIPVGFSVVKNLQASDTLCIMYTQNGGAPVIASFGPTNFSLRQIS
jgi:hypothetical protein